MKNHGLHYQIAMKRIAAGELARQASLPECDPRTAHEKGCEAERLAKEAEELSEHAKGNADLLRGISNLVHYLNRSPHQSRYRALTLTNLEQAESWLQRELGDPEPETH